MGVQVVNIFVCVRVCVCMGYLYYTPLALVQCFAAAQAVMLFTTVPPLVILLADMKHSSRDALCVCPCVASVFALYVCLSVSSFHIHL